MTTEPIRIPLGGTINAVAIIYSPEQIGMNCWAITLRSDFSQNSFDHPTLADCLLVAAEYARSLA